MSVPVGGSGGQGQKMLDAQQMQQKRQQFEDGVTKWNATVKKMEDVLEDILTRGWHGKSAPNKFKTLVDQWKDALRKVINVLREIAEAIGITGKEFEQMDTDASQAVAPLEGQGFAAPAA